jgi:hypothetical protein
VINFNISAEMLYIGIMTGVFILFLLVFTASIIRHKNRTRFYTLIIKPDGNLSKVGISFIFLWIVVLFQVAAGKEITGYFVELLGVIFAAELGERYMDSKLTVSGKGLDLLKGKLSDNDESKKTPKANEDIDF